MNRKPIELHLIDGTKPEHTAQPIPEFVRKRIPEADWLKNPQGWDESVFIKETSDYLFDVYGIGADFDKNALSMLATQLNRFIQCEMGLKGAELTIYTNDGKTQAPNPLISIQNNASKNIIQLMNELGLTPRSRLNKTGKEENNSSVAKFLRGPKG
jgi:phage terminase small subunit